MVRIWTVNRERGSNYFDEMYCERTHVFWSLFPPILCVGSGDYESRGCDQNSVMIWNWRFKFQIISLKIHSHDATYHHKNHTGLRKRLLKKKVARICFLTKDRLKDLE